jgi:hypothetical protein
MSQNREMFLLDHNPASVNTPTMTRTMNLLWAQISISQVMLRAQSLLCVLTHRHQKPNRERIEGLQIPGSLDCPNSSQPSGRR